MKAHELARELGISHKELLNFLQQRRLTRNPTAPLAPAAIEAARGQFSSTTATATRVDANGDRKVALPPNVSVKDLAGKIGVAPVEVIKKLISNGVMANINQVVDYDTAAIVADEFGLTVEPISSEDVVAVETQSQDGAGTVTTTSREEL